MVVPFGPGSGTDTVARVVAQQMQTYLGQPVTVENRAGANGFIGAEAVARSAPDGYTVFVTSASIHSLNPSLFKTLPYDTERDFAHVGGGHGSLLHTVSRRDLTGQQRARAHRMAKSKPR